jgi:hypothetical protein
MSGKCAHYWIIESTDQSEAKGQCRFCHEVRTFDNSRTCDLSQSQLNTLALSRKQQSIERMLHYVR